MTTSKRPRTLGLMTIGLILVVCCAACGGGGDGDDGGDDGPDGPGDETFTPEPEQNGGGEPGGSTGYACSLAEDCDYWFCRCDDGAVVNSALCVNGYCMDAASACPSACEYFDHGGWSGSAGGGPGTSTPQECGGLGSSDQDCDSCFVDSCCDQGESCGDSPDCLAYWDCVVPCGSEPSCRDECDFWYPDGAAIYGSLESCLLDLCSAECGS